MYRYLCIDDERKENVDALLSLLGSESTKLTFAHRFPAGLDDEVEKIVQEPPAGLVLDLRLDQVVSPEADGRRANYRGSTLAQELRTRMSEGSIRPFPIVLWSMDEKLRASYRPDDAAQDLFDALYIKDRILEVSDNVAVQLIALAEGYERIEDARRDGKSFGALLGFRDDEDAFVTDISGGRFDKLTSVSTHELARFIMHDLVEAPGVLIDDSLLAARLGVDMNKSGDWGKCRDAVATAAGYSGPFSEGWARFWMSKVEDWWSGCAGLSSLKKSDAATRVGCLRQFLKLEHLFPAEPIAAGYSTRFWTVCVALKRPLDPRDGFLAAHSEKRAWQELPYISGKAAAERVGVEDGLTVDVLERERFLAYKDELRKGN